jgi:predicted DNA-binding ribbon-helix-helix protein
MPFTVRTSLPLSTPQHEWLKREAERMGISISDLIRRIIDAYRESKGQQP